MRRRISNLCHRVSSRTDKQLQLKENTRHMAGAESGSASSTITGPSEVRKSLKENELQSGFENNIIKNPNFSEGLHNWHANSCHAHVVSGGHGVSNGAVHDSRGSYIVVTKRTQCWQGLEQDITDSISPDSNYTVTALVRVSGSVQDLSSIKATLRLEYEGLPTEYLFLGSVSVSKERWEKLNGSFSLTSLPKRVVFYLEGPSPGVDLLINSIAIFSSNSDQKETRKKITVQDDENIIQNPRFEEGLNGWSGRGGCKILLHDSMGDGKILPLTGKVFTSATERSQSWNGIQQEITGRVQRKLAYEVTAIVRVFGSSTNVDVRATLWVQAPNGREQYIGIANMQASDAEWVQLQGKFLLNSLPSKAVIFLEGPPPGVDILINSLVVKHAEKVTPLPPPDFENILYGVNVITNSSLNDGLSGWFPLGPCTLSIHDGSPHVIPPMARETLGPYEPLSGRYILAANRTQSWMGPAQTFTDKLKLHLTYQVSAWVRVGSSGNIPQNVNVAVGVDSKYVNGGQVEVSDDRWHEIGGSFRIEKQPTKVVVYLQGPSSGVDLMVAGLQIFPIDRRTRFKYLKKQTEKVRKRDITLKFSGSDVGSFLAAFVKVRQVQNSFPIGSCINRTNIDNEEFVEFFTKNFNWGVFGNELKWYWTEAQQGNFNYTDADELLDLCQRHGIQVRGHCIFWEVEGAVQSWIRSLNKDDLAAAVQNRLTGLLSRYKGKFRHYDVNNEMLHGSFYQNRLGNDIRSYMFKTTHQLDPSATLFVNDYHVEDGTDPRASPEMYIQQILSLQEQGAPVGGIGIQGHIDVPVGPIICSALNKVASLGFPIWFTELDVSATNEYVRADDLEVMLREAFAHPSIEGIMLWGFWELFMSRDNAYLVDAEGKLNEAGKRFLDIKREWLSHAHGHIDDQGKFEFRGFHGTYNVEIITTNKKFSQTFVVDRDNSPLEKTEEVNSVMQEPCTSNIIVNHDFSHGLHYWHPNSCKGHVVSEESDFISGVAAKTGEKFAVVSNRTAHWQGLEQDITENVLAGHAYALLAWVRVLSTHEELIEVKATLKLKSDDSRISYLSVGRALATTSQWTQLEGHFLLAEMPKQAIFYLEGPPPAVDLLIDSVIISSCSLKKHENAFGANILVNSCLSEGLCNWYPLGSCTLKQCSGSPRLLPQAAKDSLGQQKILSGQYLLITDRTDTWMGPAQSITERLKLNLTYQVSAWVRVGLEAAGPQPVNVAVGVDDDWVNGGHVEVDGDRWYELAGSFRIEKKPSKVIVYVQGPSPGVDLMVAGLQIFPVNRRSRFVHLKNQTDKVRKRDVVLRFSGLDFGRLQSIEVKVQQIKSSFPFGACISRSNIDNEDFVDFFLKNFNWAVFGNELKWYHTEPEQGKFNYTDADEMLDFCKRHGIETRGHCIFWEVKDSIQPWVQSLNIVDLMTAVQNRLTGLLTRYKGQFQHYDVNNEMLHGSFYRDRLGTDITAYMFKAAHQLDPAAKLFVNDYHVEDGCDSKSSPEMYIQQILDLQGQAAPIGGIGIQGHINHPVGSVICSALDKLAILGLPIWFTELDVSAENEHVRADDLEVMLREAYAHPAVEGVVLWGFWEIFTCRDCSHLVNAEGDINEAGKRYLDLRQEWMSRADGPIDKNGEFKFRGFHGTYTIEIITPSKKISETIVVEKGDFPSVITIKL